MKRSASQRGSRGALAQGDLVWVACDRCQKWRRAPPATVSAAAPWFCEQGCAGASCADAEEAYSDEERALRLPKLSFKVGGGGTSEDRRWAEAGSSLPAELRPLVPVVRQLLDLPGAHFFTQAPDLEALPGYHEAVPEPIDLGTVRRRLLTARYARAGGGGRAALLSDVRRVFANAHSYFLRDSAEAAAATELSAAFETAAAEAVAAELEKSIARHVSAARGIALSGPQGWDGSWPAEAPVPDVDTPLPPPPVVDEAARALACERAAQLPSPIRPAPGDSDLISASEEPEVAGADEATGGGVVAVRVKPPRKRVRPARAKKAAPEDGEDDDGASE